MKILKKRFILPGAIIGAAIVGGSMVYAFTSSNFASRAQTWATKVCTQSLLNSKDTTENDRTATICYNYYEDQQQDQSISSLKSTANPYLVDGNNNILGSMEDDGVSSSMIGFYDNSLGVIVDINSSTGQLENSTNLGYTTTDCTGAPYALNQIDTVHLWFGVNLGAQSPEYFIEPSSTNNLPSNQTILSEYVSGVCEPWNYNNVNDTTPGVTSVQSLTQVTPNVTFPIALPVTVK